jgi:hypothetical protein
LRPCAPWGRSDPAVRLDPADRLDSRDPLRAVSPLGPEGPGGRSDGSPGATYRMRPLPWSAIRKRRRGSPRRRSESYDRRDWYRREVARQTKRSECASACQSEHHCAEEPGSAPSPGCSVQEITHHPKRQSGKAVVWATRARTFLSRPVAKALVRRRLWLRRGAAAPPNPRLERLGRWLMCGLTSWPGARGLVCVRV